MPNIGFIGLGNMGGPMAANLVKSGERVHGFDMVAASRETSAADGVQIVGNARDCTENADIVITMLPAGEHVLSVWNDVVPHARQGTLFIDCSTIDVDDARRAHKLAAASGLATLDAPVSGGVGGAKAATLTFMVGGSAHAFARGKPVLERMGKRIVHCGEAGNGQVAKICNNMILAASMIMLLQIFATWPFPASPQCTMRLPMRSSTGLPRANACAEPPTMKVSVAALAPPTPPDTGASSVAKPLAAASLCARRASSTSMVEQSMNNVPCRACGTTSFQTDSTCSPAGSMVMTMSAFSVQSRALPT